MSLPQDIVLAGDDNRMLEFVLTKVKDPEAFLDRVKYLYAHESLRTREEIEMKDGRVLDRYSSPLEDANGKKYGRVWYFRDITERKRAERTLEERTVYLNNLFEISPMGIVVLDVEGRIQMSNSAFARLFLHSREEITGVKLDDLIVPSDQLAEARGLTAMCMSGAGAQATRQRRQKNGTLLDVNIYGVPLNINGELQGTLALYQDITERQKAEADLLKYAEDLEISKAAQEEHAQKLARLVEELACERDLMGTLMDNLPDYIFYKDRQSRLLRTNPAHAHVLGLSDPREAVGKTDFDFYPEEYAQESFRTEQQVIETRQPLIGKIERARRRDGQDRWYLTSKVPIRDGQGNVTGLVGITRDITERKQAEETLRVSEERYRELFENASDIVYTTGLDTRLTSLNRVGQRVLGYSGEEATQLDLRDLVAPRFWEKVEASRARLLSGDLDLTIEVEITTKDGRTIMLEVKPRLIYRGGKPVGVQGIGRDITGRDAAEMELRHTQKLESVGRLASGIAHEINTPIQFVGDNTRFLQDSFGGLQTLLAKYQSFRTAVESGGAIAELLEEVRSTEEASDCAYLLEEIPKALAQTLDGVTRVATIVRAMKEFAHPEGREMAAADLNRALLSTLTVARNELKYVAEVETDLGDLPLVVCNVGDINQVFLNLLVNAAHAIAERVKGTAEKGKIHVRTVSEGDAALITISDTGCGIHKANMTKIFDPFFTTKEVGRGTGQGLAIARSVVVDRHKGSLTCESEVGKGTTFFIRLPVDPGDGSREAVAP
jgi:PAS domain S-box-containing protein